MASVNPRQEMNLKESIATALSVRVKDLDGLDERDLDILYHRFVLGKSFAKCAKSLAKPVTRERVRQLVLIMLSSIQVHLRKSLVG